VKAYSGAVKGLPPQFLLNQQCQAVSLLAKINSAPRYKKDLWHLPCWRKYRACIQTASKFATLEHPTLPSGGNSVDGDAPGSVRVNSRIATSLSRLVPSKPAQGSV